MSMLAPIGSRPVNVAELMTMDWVRMKSSAVSVWICPVLGGRDSVPIFPSGSPVEKEKEAAEACAANKSKALKVEAKTRVTVLTRSGLTKQGFAQAKVWRFFSW